MQLAKAQQDKERTDAQLETFVRESRARDVQKNNEFEQVQTKLFQEQQLRAAEGAKLRRTNVLLKGKHQELKDLQADHDRLRALVEESNAARLLAGGVNIQDSMLHLDMRGGRSYAEAARGPGHPEFELCAADSWMLEYCAHFFLT